jgi:zinc protease
MQVDGLGTDYVNERNKLVEAVTIEDTKRAAHRLYKGGILVTVAGRPSGLNSSMPAKAPGG